MSTPQPPSADQLADVRVTRWHQNAGEGVDASTVALLTLESARQFVSTCGLLLFAPRSQHINSPAPTFVEATLGVSNSAPTLAEAAAARTLLTRLIAEGSVVPLNLLGAPSTTPDSPDFLASAATFSYVFTLRGDKAFKQLPSRSGAAKVSPLALNTYNLLLENGPTSAYDLATQLGKEVTEAAVLRSLNELWQHLRVLPVPQTEGNTLWETITNRFTKQLKAGANAGQPSALSALISLYLSQAILATEADIETFLSPLAPRSRVRDVIHALTGARQLETVAVEGKTHLHIHGELPTFGQITIGEEVETQKEDTDAGIELAEDGSRIKKFVPKPRKIGTGFTARAKPFSTAGRPAREERPSARKTSFSGDRGPGQRPSRPLFNKPWDEERQQRAKRESSPPATSDRPDPQQYQDVDLDAANAAPSFADKRRSGSGAPPKRPFGSRPGGSREPARFAGKPGFGGDRPAFGRGREGATGAGRPPARSFTPREGGDERREFRPAGRPSFAARKPFSRAGEGENRGENFADRRASSVERRPFRRDATTPDDRPARGGFTPGPGGTGRGPRADFKPARPSREQGDEVRTEGRPERPAFRKFDAPRGPRKPFAPKAGDDSRPPRRDFSSAGPRKPFAPREGGDARPPRRDFAGSGPRKPFPSAGGSTDSKTRERGPATGRTAGSYGPKREGGFGEKRSFSGKPGGSAGKKPFAAKPANRRDRDAPGASTFDKFKGGNKPWGNRPPGRKPKPGRGEA